MRAQDMAAIRAAEAATERMIQASRHGDRQAGPEPHEIADITAKRALALTRRAARLQRQAVRLGAS